MKIALDLKKPIIGHGLGNGLRPSMRRELNPSLFTGTPNICRCLALIGTYSYEYSYKNPYFIWLNWSPWARVQGLLGTLCFCILIGIFY